METIYLKKAESTNLYAKQNIDKHADCSIVHAKSQTAGRGRLQRKWIDFGEGNLFLTFILKPSQTFDEKYSNLTQYLSVKLCKLLENYGVVPAIKWPNDVLINGKKIAGILSESVMQGKILKGIALGIGVNLNAAQKDIAKVTDKEVTALNLELGRKVDLDKFRTELCEEFFKDYDEFLQKGFELIKSDYISRACFLDKEICVKLFDSERHGIAKSVTDKGELVLCENNKEFILTIGDIL